jgi:organic radical activating enzyme
MKKREIFSVWSRILQGYRPFLAVEITRECPLHCPGCYAYDDGHLNNGKALRNTSELRGDDLVEGTLELIHRYRPKHLSIVGGEPLLRRRELDTLLPQLNSMGLEVQFVTSAVLPIPSFWAELPNIHLVISVDGLQPEHDQRRSPANYERILRNIEGHSVIIHCVILRPMLARPNYLSEFAAFWSNRKETRKIWFSLYTPQQNEKSEERLTYQERAAAIEAIAQVARRNPIVYAPKSVMDGYQNPPASPQECIFAQTTTCLSSDLKTMVIPCQLGGQPVCSECGCFASAGFASLGRYKLGGLVKVGGLFTLSRWIGNTLHPKRRLNGNKEASIESCNGQFRPDSEIAGLK